jgi:hypothetical protein
LQVKAFAVCEGGFTPINEVSEESLEELAADLKAVIVSKCGIQVRHGLGFSFAGAPGAVVVASRVCSGLLARGRGRDAARMALVHPTPHPPQTLSFLSPTPSHSLSLPLTPSHSLSHSLSHSHSFSHSCVGAQACNVKLDAGSDIKVKATEADDEKNAFKFEFQVASKEVSVRAVACNRGGGEGEGDGCGLFAREKG